MSSHPNHCRQHGRIEDGGCVPRCTLCRPWRNLRGTTVHESRQVRVAEISEREQRAEVQR